MLEVLLSSEIVKSPMSLMIRMSWPIKGEILFYTHKSSLPFAKEVRIESLIVDGKKINREKSKRSLQSI
jgi:hypothetical protein